VQQRGRLFDYPPMGAQAKAVRDAALSASCNDAEVIDDAPARRGHGHPG
jgi:hypothetical protein